MSAIEDRDGVRFYIERTSPMRADQAGAHAGLPQRASPRSNGRRSAEGVLGGGAEPLADGHRRPAGDARHHRRAARRRARAGRIDARAPGRRWRWRGPSAGAGGAHVGPDRPACRHGRRGARRSAGWPSTRPRAVVYCSSHGGAAVAAPGRDPLRRARRRQPSRAPRRCGSGRWSAGASRRRRWCCPGARAGWPRRRRTGDAIVVPFAVSRRSRRRTAGRGGGERDVAAVTYAADAHKKGLDRVLDAWRAGAAAGRDAGGRRPGSGPSARRACAWRALADARRVPRAAAPRAGVRDRAAPRGLRDHPAGGAGRRLPAGHHARRPGPTPRCPIARQLDARLVADDLGAGAAHRARRPVARTTRSAPRDALAPFRRRRSTQWWPSGCCRRCWVGGEASCFSRARPPRCPPLSRARPTLSSRARLRIAANSRPRSRVGHVLRGQPRPARGERSRKRASGRSSPRRARRS